MDDVEDDDWQQQLIIFLIITIILFIIIIIIIIIIMMTPIIDCILLASSLPTSTQVHTSITCSISFKKKFPEYVIASCH